MWIFFLVKYFHYLGIFLVVGALCAELFLTKKEMNRGELVMLSRIDALYGFGAIITVSAGMLMWFVVGKPAEFYSQNIVFWLKVVLFTVIGVLSIWPTIFFLKNRKGELEEQVKIPVNILIILRTEVFLILLMPALAVIMANGIRLF